MRVIDENVLADCRARGRCELCGRAGPVQPHHVRSRGVCQLDVPINLLAVCLNCHTAIHFGGLTEKGRRMTRIDLYEIVSRREGIPVDTIIAELDRLTNLPTPPGEKRPRKRKPRKERKAFVRHPRCACGKSTQGKALYIGTRAVCPACLLAHLKGAAK